MLEIGNCVTILDSRRRPHLFIIITEPVGEPPHACVVNLTSYKSDKASDTTVVLEKGHSFITHKTVVEYARAMVVDVNKLESKINNRDDQTSFHKERKCSDAFLQILQQGLRRSPYTRQNILKYCVDKY